jgi:acyl carrier protein
MTDQQVLTLVNEALLYAKPERAHDLHLVTNEATLAELGIESIAALEMAAYLEEKLGKQFGDDELASITDMQAFIKLVRKYS